MKNKVIVITTGGTIEKTYDEKEGTLSNRGSQVLSILKGLRLPYTEIQHHDLLWKDSLEMTNFDRKKILKAVQKFAPKQLPIVILHGTDTMEITAQLLYKKFNPCNIPIIMTGAMKPFGFVDSDAVQNFTEALYASQMVDSGIYISMHGRIYQMPGIRKNREKGTFEKVEE